MQGDLDSGAQCSLSSPRATRRWRDAPTSRRPGCAAGSAQPKVSFGSTPGRTGGSIRPPWSIGLRPLPGIAPSCGRTSFPPTGPAPVRRHDHRRAGVGTSVERWRVRAGNGSTHRPDPLQGAWRRGRPRSDRRQSPPGREVACRHTDGGPIPHARRSPCARRRNGHAGAALVATCLLPRGHVTLIVPARGRYARRGISSPSRATSISPSYTLAAA